MPDKNSSIQTQRAEENIDLITQPGKPSEKRSNHEIVAKQKRSRKFSTHIIHSIIVNNHNQINSAEAKITKTLAIIMSCFVSCWLPFFIIYIVRSLISDPSAIDDYVMDLFIWLGYVNSSLNPIIYLIVNVNFRNSFKEVFQLFGCY